MASDPDTQSLCPGCFAAPATTAPCAVCGYDPAAPRPPTALAPGVLLNGQFLIGRLLGRPGGFGLTYLAFDRRLHARVAIKEYLPRDLAARATDGASILPHGTDDDALFRFGLGQFEQEAQTLARLDHPNIVRVRQFFEANGSAYLVMDYYQGITLAEYLERQPGGRLPADTALALLQPVLDGLRAVHAKGLLHRDIKPANIYLAQTDTGGARPILLDFGAARQAVGERSRSLSVMLTEGYAPFEQYSRKGHQGPWTDVYGAAAVLYRSVTGETPPAANDRMIGDDLKPAADFGVPAPISAALSAGLALRHEDRPQSIDTFRAMLGGAGAPAKVPVAGGTSPPATGTRPRSLAGAPIDRPPSPATPEQSGSAVARGWRLAAAVAAVAGVGALVGVGLWWTQTQNQARMDDDARFATSTPRTTQTVGHLPFEPEMVSIPAGSFLMGTPESEAQRSDNEGPQHRVQVPAFELGKYEVTFAQWDACVAADGCDYKPHDEGWGRGDRPVIGVSWDDAQQYERWLSRATGKSYRLPSEAEWEYATRAGTTTPFSTGDCITTSQANYDGNHDYNDCGAKTGVYLSKTQPVGSYPANPWGLHDLQGNVYEWTEDCWNDGYAGAPTDGGAWRHGHCGRRVARGGSWNFIPRYLRAGYRYWSDSGYRFSNLGFRVARTLTP